MMFLYIQWLQAMPVKGCPEWNAIYDLKFGKPLILGLFHMPYAICHGIATLQLLHDIFCVFFLRTELKHWLVVGGRFDLAKIPQKLQRKIAIINCQNQRVPWLDSFPCCGSPDGSEGKIYIVLYGILSFAHDCCLASKGMQFAPPRMRRTGHSVPGHEPQLSSASWRSYSAAKLVGWIPSNIQIYYSQYTTQSLHA